MSDQILFELLRAAILRHIQPETAKKQAPICKAIGLPLDKVGEGTKAERLEAALKDPSTQIEAVVERFLDIFPSATSSECFKLEERLWENWDGPDIVLKIRRDLAEAVASLPIYEDAEGLLGLVKNVAQTDFPCENDIFGMRPVSYYVEKHLIQNSDWNTDEFFKNIGAYGWSSRRFSVFVEGLASAGVRRNERAQREWVDAANPVLESCGASLIETPGADGYPKFLLVRKGTRVRGAMRTLVFACTGRKPDLRIRNVLETELQAMNDRKEVLFFDKAIPPTGLLWRDLLSWWSEQTSLTGEAVSRSLYQRLLASLPSVDVSPPQRHFFEGFLQAFSKGDQAGLPALLPEVWMHYDSKSKKQRGPLAFKNQRMDFLVLISHDVRIVVEVDGKQHYTNDSGLGSPKLYAETVKADRELKLSGYEVYRFAGIELANKQDAHRVARDFARRLFATHGVKPRQE